MSAILLNGKQLAQQQQQTLAIKIQHRRQAHLPPPGLAVILANQLESSALYVKNKRLACEKLGILPFHYELSAEVTEAALLALIHELNQRSDVHGILIQLPLPGHIHTPTILSAVSPLKDVDGFHPDNFGRLAQGHPRFRPCTPYGILQLLQHHDIPLKGKHAVIIGASNIVGRPMALEMLLAGATTTICHKKTPDLRPFVESADILVIATGTRGCVHPEWLKPHQAVIDVGMHRLPSGQVCGDLDFDEAAKRVAWLTPVPGGVGPMTITALLQNTLLAVDLNEHYEDSSSSHPSSSSS